MDNLSKKLAAPPAERRIITKPVGLDCNRRGARYADLYNLSLFASRTGTSWLSRIIHRKKFRSITNASLPLDVQNSEIVMADTSILSVASANRRFGFAFHVRQIIAMAWASFKALAKSSPGLGLLIFIPLLAIPIVLDQVVALGLPLTPTTARVVKELTGPLSAAMSRWMVIPGFIIYFAGELVWRERDNGVNEITDTMPGSEWTPVLGKFIGLCFILGLFTTALILAGMAAQLIMDYSRFELALYLKIMFGLQLPEYILLRLWRCSFMPP